MALCLRDGGFLPSFFRSAVMCAYFVDMPGPETACHRGSFPKASCMLARGGGSLSLGLATR